MLLGGGVGSYQVHPQVKIGTWEMKMQRGPYWAGAPRESRRGRRQTAGERPDRPQGAVAGSSTGTAGMGSPSARFPEEETFPVGDPGERQVAAIGPFVFYLGLVVFCLSWITGYSLR